MADPTLFTMPSLSASQLTPVLNAIKAATAADSSNTIWLEPESESSPKMKTFMEIKIVRKNTGKSASIKLGCRFNLTIIIKLKLRIQT
jgi:hypothetical protein